STIVCRGVFATNIALLQKNRFEKVIYDGRGAIKAEQEEYGVYNETGIEKEIPELEKKAVIESDKRISVSTKLIEYWQREYQYNSYNHQIIPCSLGDNFENTDKDYSLIEGLNEQDILLVYSGSIADWQALDDLESILARFLENKKVKVLFLSKPHETIVNLQKKYPDRIYRKWVSPVEVPKYLALGDYGILLRKNNWTNRVASPVKFAEYLSVGLKVLISDNIGDFSKLVVDNNLGYVVDDKILLLSKIDFFEKERIQKYSRLNFGKEFLMPKYIDVIMS
ncbi:MAG: glycosyl transferase, partial [Bacteroidota bacterium]